MAGKVGIEELKSIVSLMIKIANLTGEALSDKKISLDDAALIFKLIPAIGPAIEGAKDALPELEDLQSEEIAELAAHVMTEISVGDEKAKSILSACLKIAIAAVSLKDAIKG